MDRVRPDHEFYIKYGRAAAKMDLSDQASTWISDLCPLTLEIKDGKLKLYGTYEKPNLGAILGFGLGNPVSSDEKVKFEVTYEAEICGYAAKGSVVVKEFERPVKPSPLIDPDEKNILMVFSDDVSKITIYQESAKPDSEKFKEISKEHE